MPEPLGPMIPTLSPRMIVVVRSRIDRRGRRSRNATPLASMTSVPDRSASWTCIRAVPCRSRRCWRASRIAFERPDPALVAGPPGLDALADPDLLLGQLLVEEGVLALLGREQLVLCA